MMKHLYYLKYLLTHKWYVFIECCKRGRIWRGITHDLSKFYPSEYFPWVENFYGKDPNGKETKRNFRYAGLYHKNRNPHHWQYWTFYDRNAKKEVALRMPDEYIDEMISDWIGAGKAKGEAGIDIKEWYEMVKEDLILHKKTRQKLERRIYGTK